MKVKTKALYNAIKLSITMLMEIGKGSLIKSMVNEHEEKEVSGFS